MNFTTTTRGHTKKRKRSEQTVAVAVVKSEDGSFVDDDADNNPARIVRHAQESLYYWNAVIAPRTNYELAEKVERRLVPLIQYLDEHIAKTTVTRSSSSSSLSTKRRQKRDVVGTAGASATVIMQQPATLPDLIGITATAAETAGRDDEDDRPCRRMVRWLKQYGASLMILRSASAAAGIYGQLTVNRLSQLTGVSVSDIGTIEKMQGEVPDVFDSQLHRIATYVASHQHPWLEEPNPTILRHVLRQRVGLVLSKQLYNVEHEKRQLALITQMFSGGTIALGHRQQFTLRHQGTRCTMTDLLPLHWGREVVVVPSSSNATVFSENDGTTSNLPTHARQQQQQRHHGHGTTKQQQQQQQLTSKTVSADVVLRLGTNVWIIIEAKFISDKSNVHNKTPRMIEAKRQCQAAADPNWKLVHVAFMGGDWEVTQLQTLQREGFHFVWEHAPERLQEIIFRLYDELVVEENRDADDQDDGDLGEEAAVAARPHKKRRKQQKDTPPPSLF